ncbi:MAG: transglutaminase domain-containing protein [Ruminococcus sp.]|nr:transglutaminase domain-containing protein [Ruminococcus sp.]
MGYLRTGLSRSAAVLTACGVLAVSGVIFANVDRTAIEPSKTLPPDQSYVEEEQTVYAGVMGDVTIPEPETVTQVQTSALITDKQDEAPADDEKEPAKTTVKTTEVREPVGIVEVKIEPPKETAAKKTTETAKAPEEEQFEEPEQTAVKVDSPAVYDGDEPAEPVETTEVITTTAPETSQTTAETTVEQVQTTTTTTAAPVEITVTTTTTAAVTEPAPVTTTTTTAAPVTATTPVTTTTKAPAVTTTTTAKPAEPAPVVNDNGATPEQRLNSAVLSPNICLTGTDDVLVRTYLAKIVNDSMSNYQKALAIYDYLIKNTYYAYGGWSQPFTSVLVNGFGTCTEYSRVYAAMLRYIGFDAKTVEGQTALARGGYGYHMWVEVTINGQVYVMDPQVDDNMSSAAVISHARFCKTYSEVAGNYIKE